MKSILLQVDESIYERVISFLSLLPKEKAEYFTSQLLSPLGLDTDLMNYYHKKSLSNFPWPAGIG